MVGCVSYVIPPTTTDPVMCQMPKKARKAARRALDVLFSRENKFGTPAGVAMAMSISAGRRVDCRKVLQFFPRWESRYRAAKKQGHDARTSAVVGAWELWGGDAARKFAAQRVRKDT